jgi:hypothetical protein
MTPTGVVMILMLIKFDGTATWGVVPYDTYDSCYASLKHTPDKEQYKWIDRVCMEDITKPKVPQGGWKK